MALTQEVATWLDELQKAGELSAEERTSLETIIGKGKNQEFVKGSVLRQSDYSRKLQEFDTLKAQMTQKEADITKFQTDVANWKAGAEDKLRKAIEARANLSAKLATIGESYGIPEDEWKGDAVTSKPPEKPPETNPNYLTRDDANKALTQSALIDASLYDLGVKHQQLFGGPLVNAGQFVQEALKANKSLTDYFDEKFKVKERQDQINEETVSKRIADAVTADRQKRTSEETLPHARPGEMQHPIFGHQLKAPEPGAAPQDAVGAAVAAYQAGKYRTNIGGGS